MPSPRQTTIGLLTPLDYAAGKPTFSGDRTPGGVLSCLEAVVTGRISVEQLYVPPLTNPKSSQSNRAVTAVTEDNKYV
jgi:hypothetical protein